MMKRIISFILVAMLILSMAACKPAEVSNNPGNTKVEQGNNDGKDNDKEQKELSIIERSKGITFRHYTDRTPPTLNKHDTSVSDADFITDWTTVGFYGAKVNEAKDSFEWICEMAAEFPVDITSKYAGKYGIPADAKAEYAYSVKLNPNAKWEDGTPITADDYLYSYEQLINPKMKNFRASVIYTGNITLVNAEAYFKQGENYEDVVGNDNAKDVPESEWYISMTDPVYFFGGSAKAEYTENPDLFKSKDGRDLYKLYSAERYVKLTEQVKKDMMELVQNLENPAENWKEFCLIKVERPAIDFSEVGIKKINDYELEFVLAAPTSEFFFKYSLPTYLVKKDLYEANKQETGGLIKTSYGNDETKYQSYGPYKISEYIKDKLYVLEMNLNWYGWTDGKHEYLGNYEKRRYDYITEPEVAFQMFLNGQLDEVLLPNTKQEYAASEYLSSIPDIYIYCLKFFVDRETLRKLETPGVNRTLLSYKNFRKAFAFGINRTNFAKARNPLNRPLSGIISDLYVADPDTGQAYRDSDYGKQALIDLYGGTDVDASYDITKAREFLMTAYEEAKANGDYKDGDIIFMQRPANAESEATKLFFAVFVNAFEEIAKGTPLEGKLKVETLITDDWTGKMKNGEGQFILAGGGGGTFNPYGLMEFNIRPGTVYGFDYRNTNATIKLDGKDVTDNIVNWMDRVLNGDLRTADYDTKAYVLSRVEVAMLNEFVAIPMQAASIDRLLSKRVQFEVDKYIPVVELGERYFTMTDAEWDEYVKSQGGELDYK